MTERDHRLVRAAYWALCDLIDTQVGRMIQALEDTGQYDNTIVIFTSDHGEMLGDHGIYLKGPYFYECAVRVPLIISWPGVIPPGMRSSALVELCDLAPTLLEAAGIEKPLEMEGKSFLPLLSGDATDDHHREDTYCEYYNAMQARTKPPAYATMLRTKRYKVVVVHGHETGELYDLKLDPDERENLWDSPDHSATKMQMLKRLCDRMAWTSDPCPPRLGPY